MSQIMIQLRSTSCLLSKSSFNLLVSSPSPFHFVIYLLNKQGFLGFFMLAFWDYIPIELCDIFLYLLYFLRNDS